MGVLLELLSFYQHCSFCLVNDIFMTKKPLVLDFLVLV